MTEPSVALSDVQGIIVHGYGHLKHACFCLFTIADATAAARWIGRLPVTDAQTAALRKEARGPFVNLALTHAGLGALRLPAGLLDRFPRDFVEGAADPARAHALGDAGDSAPGSWRWGSERAPVDLFLMIYAATEAELQAARTHHEADAAASGLRLLTRLDTRFLDGRKEHFGFRDGIAQPVVAGFGRMEPKGNTIATGDVLLGHGNEFGHEAHAPSAPDGFAFAKNGSYMVARQIAQDVRGFWRYCRARSGTHGATPNPVALAAKMVGRWSSGAPIVVHEHTDPGIAHQDEDRFLYGKDPDGHRCPFGAHVRRSNPRDWLLGDTAADALKVANRHRILRRGRAYGKPVVDDMNIHALVAAADGDDDGVERGLHFICFQASIERQYEFVQQQWCNNPKFAGLSNGPDPLIGLPVPGRSSSLPEDAAFTVQGVPASRRAVELPRFVTVRGAGYFFMPSLAALKWIGSRPVTRKETREP